MKESTIKVAIVDDHELLRSGLSRIISRFPGYTVIYEAGNGEEFIKNITTQPEIPDIILLDISMPVMNGIDTAVWIKAHLPESKIIVLSMMDNEATIIRMIQLGARGYILKDSKPDVLKEAFDMIVSTGYYTKGIISTKQFHDVANGKTLNSVPEVFEKEKEFLKYACSELTYREIAEKMNVSPRTVENYRDSLYNKFNIKTRVGLVLFAIKEGFHTL